MSKETKIILIVVLLTAVLIIASIFVNNNKEASSIDNPNNDDKVVESDEAIHEEKTDNKDGEEATDEEEVLNPEDIELNFGEKARISEEEVKNLYSNDATILLLANKLIGQPAPNIEFTNIDGEKLSIDSFKGENIIVEFMGTWCPVCKEAAQDIKQFNEISDVKIIPIGLNDDAESIKEFMDELDVNEIPHYYVDTDTVLDTYEIAFVPIYFYIDKEGYVQMILAGSAPADMLQEFATKVFN